jgi:hypothetical protein
LATAATPCLRTVGTAGADCRVPVAPVLERACGIALVPVRQSKRNRHRSWIIYYIYD